MLREDYNSVEEFMESDELNEYRNELKKVKNTVGVPEEEEFDLDSIDFLEVINYPISWGIDRMDDDLGGQPVGKYIMLYGGPSTGKTTLTLQVAIENQKKGNNVRYLSFEMPKKEFIMQNMRRRAGIKQSGVGESKLPTPKEQMIMKKFVEEIRPLKINGYVNQPSLEEFKAIMNSFDGEGDHLIIIDNLGMIGRQDNKDEMQLYGEISAFVKDYCDRTGISVMMLHHTNKGSEANNGKRGFSAFRGNGKIADDCDYVIQLQREFLETGDTKSTIKVEKDRLGGRNGYALDLQFNNGIFMGDAFQ